MVPTEVAAAASGVVPVVITMAMPATSDPTWLHYLSILGAPIVAAIAAFIAWRIQTRQVAIQTQMALTATQAAETARNKLKFDLFDKRWAIYQAIQKFISHAVEKADFDKKTLEDFESATAGTRWVFSESVYTYVLLLKGKAHEAVAAANALMGIDAFESAESYSQSEIAQSSWNSLSEWWSQQHEALDEHVSPFMRLREANLPTDVVNPVAKSDSIRRYQQQQG